MNTTNRVVFNTGIVYIRLFISLVVGLFTTRIVLNALGEQDYGIFVLVAGVISMLSFLQSSMANASLRFMAHSLGSGDKELVKRTFNTTLLIHFLLGFLVVGIMEAGGWLMFRYWLNIPVDRIFDARIIFHLMVVSSFVTMISVPFDAVIASHENFLALSIIEIFGTLINFGIALYLTIITSNLLITYGFLVFLNQLLQRIIKQLYSRYKYEECKIRVKDYKDLTLLRSILSFSGWSMLGTSAAIIINQTRNILLNMFFGVSLNAANGITQTLTGQLNNVSVSMTQAINPQIIKSEGGKNRAKMLALTNTAAKFSVFLFSIFAIPVFIETPHLLQLWLKNVPDFVVVFTRIMIITMVIEKFTFPIITAIRAIGNIKGLTIAELITVSLTIPSAYFLFKAGAPPYAIYLVGLFVSLLSGLVRLYYGKKIAGLNIQEYLLNLVLKSALPIILAAGLTILPSLLMEESLFRIVITVIVSLIASSTLIRYIGLTKDEVEKIKALMTNVLVKLKLLKINKNL